MQEYMIILNMSTLTVNFSMHASIFRSMLSFAHFEYSSKMLKRYYLMHQVLFVSPERFLNAEFTSIFGDSLAVSLLVIDEAHCISEWLV